MTHGKPRFLLAGGSHADVPIITAAKALGYYVVTSGNRPSDYGHAHADEYRPADYSNPDALLSIAQDLNIAAICASANDFSALSCAFVAQTLGLPGHDSLNTALTLHHKDRYREFAHRERISTPCAASVASCEQGAACLEQFVFPVIVKPVDLTGGKGISVAQTRQDALDAIAIALARSRARRVVVEEFLTGTRHGFTSIIVNQTVQFHFVDNEHYFLNPFMVSGASAPGAVPPQAVAELIATVERIARRLDLCDGLVHVQFILQDSTPTILEICRRTPGDLYVTFVEHATGVPYSEWLACFPAGLECRRLTSAESKACVVRHCVMAPRPGVIAGLRIAPSIAPRIVESLRLMQTGDRVSDHLTAKIAIQFIHFDSKEDMEAHADDLPQMVEVLIDD